MKRILFFISFFGLVACDVKTVKNEWSEKIQVGDEFLDSQGCLEIQDHFFGLFSFPFRISKEDGSALSASSPADKEYELTDWLVKADGTVVKADEPCEPSKEESSKEEPSEKESETQV